MDGSFGDHAASGVVPIDAVYTALPTVEKSPRCHLRFPDYGRVARRLPLPSAKEVARTMKATVVGAFTICLALYFASGALAQPGMGRGAGPGPGGRMYDPKTVETVSGEVLRVEAVQGRGGRGGGHGVHLILKTDTGEVPVHLGPSWYLDKQGLKVTPGDHLEVRGSRITFEGKPAIIAAQVKKGDRSFTLRDDSGVPAWSGRGRRAP
jgi:hypothetical protein